VSSCHPEALKKLVILKHAIINFQFMDKTILRRTILTLFLLVTLLPTWNLNAMAQGSVTFNPESDSGSIVCPPGVYSTVPDDCLPLGPSQYLTNMAAEKVPYPILPLPAYSPDPSLVSVPYLYFKLTQPKAVLYLYHTLADAMTNEKSTMPLGPGEVIISYTQRVENSSGVFYQMRDGHWVRGDDGGRLAMHQPFQGLLFSSTPHNSFGWVLGDVSSYSHPDNKTPPTGNTYHRYNIVQIYETQVGGGLTWYLIGPDEWLDSRQVGRVDPRTAPPKGVNTDRWIEVNLDQQTLSVYQDDKLIFATLVSTGIDTLWTRPGIFQIYQKKDAETMSGYTAADRSDYYYIEDVPWTMYFDQKRALHGAFWHDRFGYQNSHGCVNIPDGDAHWLYNWAKVGDTVYVYDPSGKTPTDPSLFGSGAP
jgi:hypothetical protein